MKSTRSRLTIFIARWAILSGLSGTVFALLVLTRARSVVEGTQRNLLFVAAVLLSLAFVLAPFVRRAFASARAAVPAAPTRKTLLDEMREGEATIESVPESSPQPSPLAFRLLIGLYLLFGVVLIAVLGKL